MLIRTNGSIRTTEGRPSQPLFGSFFFTEPTRLSDGTVAGKRTSRSLRKSLPPLPSGRSPGTDLLPVTRDSRVHPSLSRTPTTTRHLGGVTGTVTPRSGWSTVTLSDLESPRDDSDARNLYPRSTLEQETSYSRVRSREWKTRVRSATGSRIRLFRPLDGDKGRPRLD